MSFADILRKESPLNNIHNIFFKFIKDYAHDVSNIEQEVVLLQILDDKLNDGSLGFSISLLLLNELKTLSNVDIKKLFYLYNVFKKKFVYKNYETLELKDRAKIQSHLLNILIKNKERFLIKF